MKECVAIPYWQVVDKYLECKARAPNITTVYIFNIKLIAVMIPIEQLLGHGTRALYYEKNIKER